MNDPTASRENALILARRLLADGPGPATLDLTCHRDAVATERLAGRWTFRIRVRLGSRTFILTREQAYQLLSGLEADLADEEGPGVLAEVA